MAYKAFDLVITYVNNSVDVISFLNALEARRYARNKISYSSGKVWQVELCEPGKMYGEVLWNFDWDDVSKEAGLTITF